MRPAGSFPGLLHCWQEKCDEDGNNRDHDKQLNQRESALACDVKTANLPETNINDACIHFGCHDDVVSVTLS